MENRAGRGGRRARRKRNGEPARGGGRGGRTRDCGEPSRGDPAASGDPPLNGEERIGRGGGGHGRHGGKHNGYADQSPLLEGAAGKEEWTPAGVDGDPAGELQVPPLPRDGKEGDSGGRGAHRGCQIGEADQENLDLGGPGGQPRQRADEEAAYLFPTGGAPAHPDGHGDGKEGNASDGKEENASGDGDGKEGRAGMKLLTTRRLTTRPAKKRRAKARASAARFAAASSTLLPRSNFLSTALLSWSMKDVFNEDLYKDEVLKHPNTFDSAEDFINLYSRQLKEETRAVFYSAIQDINQTAVDYCQLRSVKQADALCGYYLDVDLAMTRSDDIQCQHIAKDFDICLLSSRPPLDPNLDIMSCHIGMVVGVGPDIFFQRSFTVFVSDYKEFVPQETKFACFLTNIKHKMQTANILCAGDERNKNAVRAVVELYKAVGKKCNTCPTVPDWKDGLPSGNNECLVSSLRCLHTKHAEVVWAPPGTLNWCVASVLKDLLHQRPKVLICLPSTSYLPDVLSNLSELSLPDFLVLNSRGQEVTELYDNFFLGHQAQELFCCLTQRKALKSMSSLLDFNMHYHIGCTDGDSCAHCSNSGLLKFCVQSFKQKFVVIMDQLLGCLVYLKSHSTAFSLLAQDTANIEELINVLEKFKALLHDKDLTDDCVATAFELVPLANVTSKDSASTILSSLREARMDCIRLISSIESSLQFPEFKSRDDLERFCIRHSTIAVATLDCISQLHGVEMGAFDILLVYGASQITEDQLLVSFLHPVRHTILFGDQHHLQPFIRSKMCKEAGYDISIFERLQHSVSKKEMLKIQFAIHPSIIQFPNNYFYDGNITDGSNVRSSEYSEFLPRTLPSYSFLDISATELRQSRKSCINSAVIFMLVQKFYDVTRPTGKINICVVCLSKDESNSVRNMLRFKNEIYDRINLEVKSIDNLQEEYFDVIILSLLAQDLTVTENNLNVALTSSRHCLWIIGERNTLVRSGGIWTSLIDDADRRLCSQMVDSNELADFIKELEMIDNHDNSNSNSALSRKITHMPGQELTWAERPYMTKKILADVRNQQGQLDTCSFQSTSGVVESLLKIRNADLVPPQECNWKFLLDDWKSEYATVAPKPFGSEDRTDRGEKRLQTSFELYKINGVMACDEYRGKFRRFKIKEYGSMDKGDTEAVTAHLEKGGIMVGTFGISRNYFSLRPDEVYVYDPDKAITHEKSGLSASHVAMMIGIGHRLTQSKRFSRHMVMQNSEGKLYGINGIGRIGKKQTLRKLYWIEIDAVKPKPARTALRRRRRHRCYYRRRRNESDAQREALSGTYL